MSVRRWEEDGGVGGWGGATSEYVVFVCKLLPREIISALRGRILRPSGGSHKPSRSHPATKFDCVASVPGGSFHSGVDVVVVCCCFFWYTNTIWQKASVSSLGANGTSNTGITVQILEHLSL